MPDDHYNFFGSSSEPSREVSHAACKQVVGLHSDTPIILLTTVPPRVAEMVKGQHRKLGRRWRPADIAAMFEPLPVQVGDDYRDSGLTKKPHCRLDRARERRYHD